MAKLKIYIASSWKNQHIVEALTFLFRGQGWEVISWIENNYNESYSVAQKTDFEKWVNTPDGVKFFLFDINGAMNCDVCVYVSPSGKDAAAETGAAYAKGKPIIGLYAKGEDFGLMRKMITKWVDRYYDVIPAIKSVMPNPFACYGGQKPTRMDFDDANEYNTRLNAYDRFEANRNK